MAALQPAEARRGFGIGSKSVRRGAAAYGLAALGILGVKSVLLLNALASLAGEDWSGIWKSRRARRLLLAAGIPAAALVLGLALWSGWLEANAHKVWTYLQTGGGAAAIPHRALTLENRLGLLALSPALALLAALGALYLPVNRLERVAIATAALHGLLLALWGYSPIRYLLPAFPSLALLAARAAASIASPPPAPARGPLPAWLRAGRGALAAYVLLQGILAATGARGVLQFGAAMLLAGALGALAEAALGGSSPAARRPAFAWTAAVFLLLSVVDLCRAAAAIAAPERSIARAGDEVEAILHPAAHLTGPFAHVLTYESSHRRSFHPVWGYGRGRLGRELRQAGFTHFAVEVSKGLSALRRTFQADGAALDLVHEFVIRGQKVHLYRFPWADGIAPPTEFELGVQAIQAGDWNRAESHLRRAAAFRPASSAAASALGLVLLETGRAGEARGCLERALETNPYEVSALRSLLRLHLQEGDLLRARPVLERLVRLDPEDQDAARLLARL